MIKTSFNFDSPLLFVQYGRMSDEGQNPRSPDQQFDEIDRTKTRQRRDNWVHVKTIRDDGISGRYHRKRPGFSQMLDEIRSGQLRVDLILVDTLERFARLEELPAIREELRKKYGVLILTADSNFTDPTSPAGQMLGTMEAMRASSAAGQKAHDVLRGKIDAVMRKRWPGGSPNCGYLLAAHTETVTRRNGKTVENIYHLLEPDPARVEIPRRIYQLAYDHSWGRHRIAKTLNADAGFVNQFDKISDSQVGSIMQNTIYKGLFRFNFRATDIQDDCRISQKNDPEEVIYVDGFCEAIVPAEIVDKVHADLRRRSELALQLRAAKDVDDGKQIQPVIHGVSLVYPLAGLVRCGKCEASMLGTTSGTNSKQEKSYRYYRCPCNDGRCTNTRYLPADWLFEVVVARLRDSLYPLALNGEKGSPAWLPEFLAEVRRGLESHFEREPDRRPMLERESKEINSKAAGWTESLSKNDLSPLVRNQIEQQLDLALRRQQAIGVELEMLANAKQYVSTVLDPSKAVDRLRRLAEVLVAGNPSDVNEQLAKHIESIVFRPDGTVVMRTSRLGLFEGVSELLAGDNENAVEEDGDSDVFKIRKRALTRRRTTGDINTSTLEKPSGVVETLVALPDNWVDEAIFQVPVATSFPKEYGEEVFLRRQESKLSYGKLAAKYGVTRPTIRAAMEYYLKNHPEAADQVKLQCGGRRPPKFDLSKIGPEARSHWEAGWSKLQLAEKFGCSPPTVDKALVWAYQQDGLPVPSRQDIKAAKVAAARTALDSGQPLEEIARTLNVSDVTARRYLRDSFTAEGKSMPDLRTRPRKPE